MATTYGLEVYSASSQLIYSSADVTWNQVDYFTVPALPAPQSVTNTYPVIIGREVLVLQLLVDTPPTDRRALAHTISKETVTTGSVTVSGGSENALILVLMR
jgi:hypothetical protein